jgi:diadenylate cyclase
LVLAGFAGLGEILDLNAVTWLFSKLFLVLIVAIPIIFQPEIRDALSLMSKKSRRFEDGLRKEKDEVHHK